MRLMVLGSSSLGNCYLLVGENETLILECGISYKSILKGLNFDLSKVIGCLVTHEHKDHSKAINELIKNGINVYSSRGTAEACEVSGYRVKTLESEKQINIGEFTILPFTTQHDAAEPLGFLIQHKDIGKLLFITDSYYCQYKFKGLNHILIECNYSNAILMDKELPKSLKARIVKSHFELENVKDLLRSSERDQIKEIMLIHLSDGNSDSAKFKSDIERLTGKPVYVASKGLEIELF